LVAQGVVSDFADGIAESMTANAARKVFARQLAKTCLAASDLMGAML
jgi:hypothetical protein